MDTLGHIDFSDALRLADGVVLMVDVRRFTFQVNTRRAIRYAVEDRLLMRASQPEATAGLVHGDFRIDNFVFHHYIVDISLDKVENNGCLELLTEMPEEFLHWNSIWQIIHYCVTAGFIRFCEMEGEKKILVQSVNKFTVNGEEIGLPVGTTFQQLEFHMVDLERGECLHNYTPPLTKFVPAYTMVSVGKCVYLVCPLSRFQPDATSRPKLFFGSTRLDFSLDTSQDEVCSSIQVHATVSDTYRRCISLLGKLYSFGLWKLTPEVLDVDGCFWEPLPCLPPRLQGCSVSVNQIPDPSNNRILLCLDGGQLPSSYLYSFTPLDNEWRPLVPDFHNWTDVAAVVDDVIYFHSHKFPSVIRAFDLVCERWLTVTWSSSFDDGVDMNGVRMEFDALLPLGGKVLCLAVYSQLFDYDNSLTSNTQISFPKFRVHHNPNTASVRLSPISSHSFVLPESIRVHHFVAV